MMQSGEAINRSVASSRAMSMSLPDKLLLDPVEKFEKYSKQLPACLPASLPPPPPSLTWPDRFPWKMMVQIILICLTSALVFLVISNVSDYRRSINIIWKNLFLDDVRTPLPLPLPSVPLSLS